MNKILLKLTLCSANLIAVFLVSYSTYASPVEQSTVSLNKVTPVNLSISSSNINLTPGDSNPILKHLTGCNCQICSGAIKPKTLL
jgi:hypothetical protein